jgi:hypothetical protein
MKTSDLLDDHHYYRRPTVKQMTRYFPEHNFSLDMTEAASVEE